MAIPIATYAFCGVEIAAIAALESANARSLRFPPTRYVALVILVVYSISIFMFYLNVSWRDPLLISLPKRSFSPSSIVMIAAINANIPTLPGFLNGCLFMAVISSANTSLYVASRTLYGLTRGFSPNGSWFERCLYKLGTTDKRGVPALALFVSGTVFGIWLPFVHSARRYKDEAVSCEIPITVSYLIVYSCRKYCLE